MKKILYIGFVLSLIIAGFSISSSISTKDIKASEYHDDLNCTECVELSSVSIEPEFIICTYCCGTSEIVTTVSEWEKVEKSCEHEYFGTDEWEERTIETANYCSQCNRLLDVPSVRTESKYIMCHGWQ